ncbi:hypothetical protein ACP4OV_011187 [Aristida adscensionis]
MPFVVSVAAMAAPLRRLLLVVLVDAAILVTALCGLMAILFLLWPCAAPSGDGDVSACPGSICAPPAVMNNASVAVGAIVSCGWYFCHNWFAAAHDEEEAAAAAAKAGRYAAFARGFDVEARGGKN